MNPNSNSNSIDNDNIEDFAVEKNRKNAIRRDLYKRTSETMSIETRDNINANRRISNKIMHSYDDSNIDAQNMEKGRLDGINENRVVKRNLKLNQLSDYDLTAIHSQHATLERNRVNVMPREMKRALNENRAIMKRRKYGELEEDEKEEIRIIDRQRRRPVNFKVIKQDWDFDNPCSYCKCLYLKSFTKSERKACCNNGEFMSDRSNYPMIGNISKPILEELLKSNVLWNSNYDIVENHREESNLGLLSTIYNSKVSIGKKSFFSFFKL